MSDFKQGDAGASGDWFYCLKHHTVEKGPDCRAADRLGPYASREEAARAVETTHERNEEWDTDPRWSDDKETPEDK
ncbi:hypothetical protein OIB37_03820 [Streptomyces sp. NBC_00820]|uniref:hypothetical protein n=1 Tax=Streptomyces sp. NBC_00820 TaxID=2975842 RepID=UPI002ED2C8FF|nr:hypothetical protein OIB37_03820 [Streptomyces sp. NBC_00820]